MNNYMVMTMDHGKKERRYYKTERGARRFFESCGSAVLYKYNPNTCYFEEVDAI